MSTRTRYDDDIVEAFRKNFYVRSIIRHYKSGEYEIVGEYMITDNGEYDGRLGFLYRAMFGTDHTTYGRPFAQMIENHHDSGPSADMDDPLPNYTYEQKQRFVVTR